LGAQLASGSTTITLAAALKEGGTSGTNIATLGTDEYLVLTIEDEVLYLTAYTSGATSGTVSRGKEGTVDATHANGSSVRHVPTKIDAAVTLTPDDLTTFNAVYGAPLSYDEEFDGPGGSLPSGWGWTNQGSSTFDMRFGAGIIQCVASDSTNLRMITRNLPSESTWTAFLSMTSASANNTGGDSSFYGIVLHEVSSGKSVMIRKASQSGAIVTVCTSTAFAGAANVSSSDVPSFASAKQVFRVRRNSATSYDFYFSADNGVSWVTLITAYDVTANFTTAPDKIGVICNNGIAHVCDYATHWFRVR
jgi:hypothetical protein